MYSEGGLLVRDDVATALVGSAEATGTVTATTNRETISVDRSSTGGASSKNTNVGNNW